MRREIIVLRGSKRGLINSMDPPPRILGRLLKKGTKSLNLNRCVSVDGSTHVSEIAMMSGMTTESSATIMSHLLTIERALK